MYTGKTEKPCCLCDDPETAARVDLPPRAIPHMKHGDPIAWQDVEGEVSIHFCASDWAVVRDLVLDAGMSPLDRCNAARAAFDLREDFEAMTRIQREEPDHTDLEERMLDRSRAVLADPESHTDRERVQANLVVGVIEGTDGASPERRQRAGADD